MKACPRCGIEFEENMTICPLCLYTDSHDAANEKTATVDAQQKPGDRTMIEYTTLTGQQKRKLFWEISAMVLLSGILVTVVIDLITVKSISWSKYTITVCLVLFTNITLISFLRHRLFILLFGSFITTSLLLVLLDVYNERLGWGTQLGIPLLFSLYVVIYILAVLFRITRQHGFNMLAYIFLAAGLLAICIESITRYYNNNEISLRWSLIVLVCLIPVAAILLYIHYRLNKGAELRRFFHI